MTPNEAAGGVQHTPIDTLGYATPVRRRLGKFELRAISVVAVMNLLSPILLIVFYSEGLGFSWHDFALVFEHPFTNSGYLLTITSAFCVAIAGLLSTIWLLVAVKFRRAFYFSVGVLLILNWGCLAVAQSQISSEILTTKQQFLAFGSLFFGAAIETYPVLMGWLVGGNKESAFSEKKAKTIRVITFSFLLLWSYEWVFSLAMSSLQSWTSPVWHAIDLFKGKNIGDGIVALITLLQLATMIGVDVCVPIIAINWTQGWRVARKIILLKIYANLVMALYGIIEIVVAVLQPTSAGRGLGSLRFRVISDGTSYLSGAITSLGFILVLRWVSLELETGGREEKTIDNTA